MAPPALPPPLRPRTPPPLELEQIQFIVPGNTMQQPRFQAPQPPMASAQGLAGACSDARRTSLAASSGRGGAFTALAPFTGRRYQTSRPPGGLQYTEGERSARGTAGTRLLSGEPTSRGWTVNEIPSTPRAPINRQIGLVRLRLARRVDEETRFFFLARLPCSRPLFRIEDLPPSMTGLLRAEGRRHRRRSPRVP